MAGWVEAALQGTDARLSGRCCRVFGLGAAMLAVLCVWHNRHFFHDDAFITLRYARHLAGGAGPVWNVGEAPVDGFTSPLHLLLLSFGLAVGLPPEWAARAVGFACHAALSVLVWRRARADAGAAAGWCAVLLVGASFPLLVWDLGGLETSLFALAAFAAIDRASGYFDPRGDRGAVTGPLAVAGLLFGVAVWVRPDGVVFAGATLGSALLFGARPWRRRLGDVCAAGLAVLLAVLPLEAGRLALFGSLWPNTYVAKVQTVPLMARLVFGVRYLGAILVLPPFTVAAFGAAAAWLRPPGDRRLALLACNVAAYLLAVTMAGGDHMRAARFLAPVVAPASVGLAVLLARRGWLERGALALVALCTLQGVVPALNPVVRDQAALVGTVVGRYIAAAWPRGSVVALNTAGSTPFFADGDRFIDMLGLNDRVIARRVLRAGDIDWAAGPLIGHLKGDGGYVLGRRPDFIIAGPSEGALLAPGETIPFLTERALLGSAAFREGWRACMVAVPVPADLRGAFPQDQSAVRFTFYARRDVRAAGCP